MIDVKKHKTNINIKDYFIITVYYWVPPRPLIVKTTARNIF